MRDVIGVVLVLLISIVPKNINAQWDDLDSLLKVVENTDNDTVKAHNFNKISHLYNSIDLDSSLFYAQKALEQAEAIPYSLEINRAYKHLGRCYAQKHKYNLALFYLEQAMKLDSSYMNEGALAETFISLGNVYRNMEKYDFARSFDSLAYSIFKDFPSNQAIHFNVAACLVNLGTDYYHIKQYDSSRVYLARLKKHLGPNAHPFFLFHYYDRLGDVFFKDSDNFDQALNCYDSAMYFATASGQSGELGGLFNKLAKIYIETGDYDQALTFLEKAASNVEKLDSEELRMTNLEYFVDYYLSVDNVREANKYLLQLSELKDTLYKKDNSLKLAEFEVMHKTLEKENEILSLKEENWIEREKRLRLTFLLIIIAGLIFIITAIIIRRNRNSTKEKKILKQELELKDRELTSNALSLVKRNEILTNTSEKLTQSKSKLTEENQVIIQAIISNLRAELSDSGWAEFEMRFLRVHPTFYDNLRKDFPDITAAELKLAALLRLEMSTKEISSLTGSTPRSVEVSRSRLRKRLYLSPERNLQSFLSRI